MSLGAVMGQPVRSEIFDPRRLAITESRLDTLTTIKSALNMLVSRNNNDHCMFLRPPRLFHVAENIDKIISAPYLKEIRELLTDAHGAVGRIFRGLSERGSVGDRSQNGGVIR